MSHSRCAILPQGFKHYELFFPDGTPPPEAQAKRFLKIVEQDTGVVAVHCKAGLGRTGTLILMWAMKHFKLTAKEAIGYLRVARPGSIIGPQQQFLAVNEKRLWRMGGHGQQAARPRTRAEETGALPDFGENSGNRNGSRGGGRQQQQRPITMDGRDRRAGGTAGGGGLSAPNNRTDRIKRGPTAFGHTATPNSTAFSQVPTHAASQWPQRSSPSGASALLCVLARSRPGPPQTHSRVLQNLSAGHPGQNRVSTAGARCPLPPDAVPHLGCTETPL